MKHYRLWWTAFFVVMGATCALAQDHKSTQATINIRDYCDPESFNAVIGPDTCVRDTSDSLITFSGFVNELGTDKSVGAWRFAPAQLSVAEGAVLELHNLGGETHTFTQVKRFGGGFVDFLNAHQALLCLRRSAQKLSTAALSLSHQVMTTSLYRPAAVPLIHWDTR